MLKFRACAVFTVALACAWCAAFATESPGVISLRPQLTESENYSESFTAIADFKDGTYALLQLFVSNAGLGDQKAACRVMVRPPQGDAFNRGQRFERKQWSYKPSTNTLQVQKCSLSTRQSTTVFSAKLRDIQVVIEVDETVGRTIPPGQSIETKNGRYKTSILLPWAKAQARIEMPGYTNRRLEGYVYLDRARSTLPLVDIAQSWYRFRGFYGAKPALAEVRYGPNNESVTGWIWRASSRYPKPIDGPVTRQVDQTQVGLKIPVKDGYMVVTTSHKLAVYRPTRQYGLIGRLAKPWVGDPEVTTYRAKLVHPDGTIVSGVLEQTLVNH